MAGHGDAVEAEQLAPVELCILVHLKRAGAEYAKGASRRLGIRKEAAEEALRRLEATELVERSSGSAIKRTEAKFKLAREVRKHHLYFTLSRRGEHLVRGLLREGIAAYLGSRYAGWSPELLELLRRAGCENHLTLSRMLSRQPESVKAVLERMRRDGLVEACTAKVLKRKHRRAKPKKETRTHHRYYRLSRMGELLLRGGI